MNSRILGFVMAILGVAAIAVDASFVQEFMARGLELHKTCPLPPDICPFIEPPWQGIFIGVLGFALIAIGVYVYRKRQAAEPKNAAFDSGRAENTLKTLEGDENSVYRVIIDEKGMAFQGKLIDKTWFTKVKVSRILDSLESKGLVERRRRGMSNVVVIK